MSIRFRIFRYIARHSKSKYIQDLCFYYAHLNTNYICQDLLKKPNLHSYLNNSIHK